MAVALLVTCAKLIWTADGPLLWHRVSWLAAGLLCVPFVQYAVGQIQSVGVLWINVAYLLGFLLAALTGTKLAESSNPYLVLDGLFIAVGVAAVFSTGIQLSQWMQVHLSDIWVMEGGDPRRPYANLGQANQLATLLVWGLLAIGWGVWRKSIAVAISCGAAVFLLIGLALTRSRTAMVAVLLIVIAAWLWRGLMRSRSAPWLITGLAFFFLGMVYALPKLRDFAFGDSSLLAVLDTASAQFRLLYYKTYIAAILDSPLFGYGWDQGAFAQFAMADRMQPLNTQVSYSHNLVLDVIAWCGIPLGLLVVGAFCWWLISSLRRVADAGDALLCMLVVTVGVHAMLEFPLYYGYFLWPVGLVAGVLGVRLKFKAHPIGGRYALIAMWLVCAGLVGVVGRDYLVAEQNYTAFRFETNRVGTFPPAATPDLMVLTQLEDLLWMARFEPAAGISDLEVKRLERVATMYPSLPALLKVAETLAMNNQPDRATQWLKRIPMFVAAQHHAMARRFWEEQQRKHEQLANVAWPS